MQRRSFGTVLPSRPISNSNLFSDGLKPHRNSYNADHAHNHSVRQSINSIHNQSRNRYNINSITCISNNNHANSSSNNSHNNINSINNIYNFNNYNSRVNNDTSKSPKQRLDASLQTNTTCTTLRNFSNNNPFETHPIANLNTIQPLLSSIPPQYQRQHPTNKFNTNCVNAKSRSTKKGRKKQKCNKVRKNKNPSRIDNSNNNSVNSNNNNGDNNNINKAQTLKMETPETLTGNS